MPKLLVQATYLFPNGMVCTVGWNDEQIAGLQGRYSKELHNEIIKRSDSQTIWNGFPNFK